jgi:tRNA dimethylallyltransferase
LLEKYGTEMPTAMQGLGYKEVKQFFDGELTEDEMIEKIKQETRRYAKRQLTWFRKMDDVHWYSPNQEEEILSLVKDFLN